MPVWKKRTAAITAVAFLLLAGISACRKNTDTDPLVSSEPTAYDLDYPSHFPPMPIPSNNPMTKEGVLLGRYLYYDNLLSLNGPKSGLSCSSCHNQALSFSTNGSGTSVLPHVNLGWNKSFLWNGKVEGTMEDIMRFEVEEFFQTNLDALRNDPKYPSLYRNAFGSEEITYERTEFALAQFFRSLVSYKSEYDRVILMQGVDTYSDDEADGYLIFFSEKGDCFHCHSSTLLSDNSFRNIGLDSVFTGDNLGRYTVSQNPADIGKFKVPTLRNIALTAPYMHDGRFSTLEEVIDHYNTGVKKSPTLDPIMTKPGKELGLQLSVQEKKSLVAFLKTLTDTAFTSDKNHSSPF